MRASTTTRCGDAGPAAPPHLPHRPRVRRDPDATSPPLGRRTAPGPGSPAPGARIGTAIAGPAACRPEPTGIARILVRPSPAAGRTPGQTASRVRRGRWGGRRGGRGGEGRGGRRLARAGPKRAREVLEPAAAVPAGDAHRGRGGVGRTGTGNGRAGHRPSGTPAHRGLPRAVLPPRAPECGAAPRPLGAAAGGPGLSPAGPAARTPRRRRAPRCARSAARGAGGRPRAAGRPPDEAR